MPLRKRRLGASALEVSIVGLGGNNFGGRIDFAATSRVVHKAIELDINPEWPTFNIYAHRHGLLPSKFVPNPQQAATRYLRPDSRDFFAVYRRIPGAVTVPFR